MDGSAAKLSEESFDHEKLIQGDRNEEVALHADTRQPDFQSFEELAITQPRRPQQLGLSQAEKAEVGLVVNDARRIDVLPADILLDFVAHRLREFWNGPAELYAFLSALVSCAVRMREGVAWWSGVSLSGPRGLCSSSRCRRFSALRLCGGSASCSTSAQRSPPRA